MVTKTLKTVITVTTAVAPPVLHQKCPSQMPVPYFGAPYEDSQCIDGYLFDLDNCDDEGNLYGGEDIPCPFCLPVEHAQYFLDDATPVCEVCSTTLSDLHWAETQKPSVKLYGKCPKCNSHQWANVVPAQDDNSEDKKDHESTKTTSYPIAG